ncbi:lytic polysaccharide monooxygenase [Xylariomycetidae sp. FL2044]|nr:lytic polysaccharide monooxygenase [Xylariomycetidae sp. FL2044]
MAPDPSGYASSFFMYKGSRVLAPSTYKLQPLFSAARECRKLTIAATMKVSFSTLTILGACLPRAWSHWTYNRLIVNGEVVGEPWQYVRRNNNTNEPLQNVNSTDMRCNSGALSGKDTQTYTVQAGGELGFGIGETFGHPGIQQVYLSKAPGAAADYDGSGDWARIYSLTYALPNTADPSNDTDPEVLEWATDRMHSFLFTLPASTPPGEYLLRSEGLALHAAHKVACAQFYVACAQIKVTGTGSGDMGPTSKIPGVYRGDEPGVLIPVFWSYMTNYTAPGPALWPRDTLEQHVAKRLPSG